MSPWPGPGQGIPQPVTCPYPIFDPLSPPARIRTGTEQKRQTDRLGQDTPRAVRLLRSRRKTFLFNKIFKVYYSIRCCPIKLIMKTILNSIGSGLFYHCNGINCSCLFKDKVSIDKWLFFARVVIGKRSRI